MTIDVRDDRHLWYPATTQDESFEKSEVFVVCAEGTADAGGQMMFVLHPDFVGWVLNNGRH